MRADLRAAALAWYNAMGVIQMMKRMILAILALLLAAPGALAELPDSIQIVVGETYDFGEAISGAEGIASISGRAQETLPARTIRALWWCATQTPSPISMASAA